MNNIKKYYITIDGEDIEVTEELYYAYKRPAWREHKQRKIRSEKVRSLDQLLDDGFDIPEDNSVEDMVIENIEYEILHSAMEKLPADEQKLINEKYFEERTEQEIAEEIGHSQSTVNRRINKILNKLKILL